jgi:hypothetical protein
LWHAGLIADNDTIIEIANGSFRALIAKSTDRIFAEKTKNLVVFRFPWLTLAQRKEIVAKARKQLAAGAAFNHLCMIGMTLSQMPTKVHPKLYWGWPERHLRYGFVCVEFVAYAMAPYIFFRPGKEWWQGTTNDDIVDLCELDPRVRIVYQFGDLSLNVRKIKWDVQP